MKPLGNEREIMVLGSGLGGLVAGTLLTKKGHSVLLLRERGYQPSYATQGYHFVPFSNFSEKRFRYRFLRKISQGMNFPFLMDPKEESNQTKIIPEKRKERATFQVILPKARVDIFPQRSLSQMEWKREFPEEVAQIGGFYNELDQIQPLFQKVNRTKNSVSFFPFRQRSFIKNIFSFGSFPKERVDEKLSPFSNNFKKFIQLQLISWGNLYSDQFPISLGAHILSEETNEFNPNFDIEKLEREILDQFLKSGGRIEEIDRVKNVNLEWRKGITLLGEGDPRVFRSKFFIYNSPLHRISSLQGKKGRELSKWGEKIKPLYVMIPLFLGVREKVIPVGMKDFLISIMDIEKPYHDGNVLFFSLSPKGDETKAPEGRRALIVESVYPLSKWEQTPLIDFQKGVMGHLNHLFPFLEDHIEFIDFQWASEQVPKWSYPHFVYEAISDFDWRDGVVPVRVSKNIYFVGKENFPYLGLEGEILSGFMAAQQILKKSS
jgi:phytoene dehydrogenase-like protein